MILMDGMTGWNTNVEEAIRRCHEITTDDSKITVDVMTCGFSEVEKKLKERTSIENYMRGREIEKVLTGTDSIEQVLRAHPKVNVRHYIEQMTGKATGFDELTFESTTTWPLQEQGRLDAQASLATLDILYSPPKLVQ
jgi:hypothetical protein